MNQPLIQRFVEWVFAQSKTADNETIHVFQCSGQEIQSLVKDLEGFVEDGLYFEGCLE